MHSGTPQHPSVYITTLWLPLRPSPKHARSYSCTHTSIEGQTLSPHLPLSLSPTTYFRDHHLVSLPVILPPRTCIRIRSRNTTAAIIRNSMATDARARLYTPYRLINNKRDQLTMATAAAAAFSLYIWHLRALRRATWCVYTRANCHRRRRCCCSAPAHHHRGNTIFRFVCVRVRTEVNSVYRGER